MKTRSIKVLLTILLTELETNGLGENWGLCSKIAALHNYESYSLDEYNKLHDYIDEYRPMSGIHFDRTRADGAWYWELGKVPPRIAWLKYRIKKH